MRKSFIRSLAILGMAGVMSVNTFGMTFKDVSANHWAYDSVLYMQQKGYMVTNSQGEFFPNNQMTYFDIADILAKATGYVDENVVKDMDAKLKQSIRDNYAKQKPTLDKYTTKYKSWKSTSNEEIAYLLGRGYLKSGDLDSFMIATQTGQEVGQILSKEDLAVYLVRVLQKEKSAVDEYKSTGFKDEEKISKDARPHVAYLKKIGVVGADANGNFNPKEKVSKAVCAKMTAETLKLKDKEETNSSNNNNTNAGQTQDMMEVKINKVIVKDQATGELYILVEKADKSTTFYSMKKNAKVTDGAGKALTTNDVKVGQVSKVKIVKENGTEYISEMQVQSSEAAGGNTNTGGTTAQTTLYTGTVERIGRAGDITLATDKGMVTYMVSGNVTVDQIAVGDMIKAYVQGDKITRIEMVNQGNANVTSTVEFVSATQKVDTFVVTVKQGTATKTINVAKDALVLRNDKKSSVLDLKIGDELKLVMKGTEAVEVNATSEQKTYKGKVQSILIAAQPQITVGVGKDAVTFNVTADTEIYDTNTRKDVTIRELQIGSQVELISESKEAISVIVDKAPSNVTYKGTIDSIGKGGKSIDMLAEYDPMTGETMTVKRINVSIDVKIMMDGKEQSRSVLEEGMEVLVKYKYGEEMSPVEIQVLSK